MHKFSKMLQWSGKNWGWLMLPKNLGRDLTPDLMRAIRARKGVGRPPQRWERWRNAQADHVNHMADGGHFLVPRWVTAWAWLPPAKGAPRNATVIDSTAALRKSKRRKGRVET